jgi:predicted Zn-dependent peptidase
VTVRLTKLPNGLTVASDRMEQVETATVGVWVQVGTRHETAAINGVSHVLEHMAFKGTRRRSARAIAEEIEAVGGHLNAYTAREGTTYFAKVMKEDIGLAVDIIADILQHSVFDPEELQREREVILQEIGQARDTPDDIIFDHFQETAFPDQPLGRPVLGKLDHDWLV